MLTPVERVLILKGADLLRDVGPRHLLRLAEVVQEMEIARGASIYRENDRADAMYMVVEGRVRLSTESGPMSEVGPGEAFGTWALVDDSERGHRADCIEDGLALALPRDEFYDVAAGDLTLLREVVRALAKRLRELASGPEEARVEGEGIEKPEAMTETAAAADANPRVEVESDAHDTKAEETVDVVVDTPVTAPPPSAGAALEAAATGQPKPPEEDRT